MVASVPPIPDQLDGATVICYSPIDNRHKPTGGTQHYRKGLPQGEFAGLAICRYEGAADFYLFYCDESWNVVNDTCHESLELALRYAELEYTGVRDTWVQCRTMPLGKSKS